MLRLLGLVMIVAATGTVLAQDRPAQQTTDALQQNAARFQGTSFPTPRA
jgi:hypothetical protein